MKAVSTDSSTCNAASELCGFPRDQAGMTTWPLYFSDCLLKGSSKYPHSTVKQMTTTAESKRESMTCSANERCSWPRRCRENPNKAPSQLVKRFEPRVPDPCESSGEPPTRPMLSTALQLQLRSRSPAAPGSKGGTFVTHQLRDFLFCLPRQRVPEKPTTLMSTVRTLVTREWCQTAESSCQGQSNERSVLAHAFSHWQQGHRHNWLDLSH